MSMFASLFSHKVEAAGHGKDEGFWNSRLTGGTKEKAFVAGGVAG
jgi:hypothetical protein